MDNVLIWLVIMRINKVEQRQRQRQRGGVRKGRNGTMKGRLMDELSTTDIYQWGIQDKDICFVQSLARSVLLWWKITLKIGFRKQKKRKKGLFAEIWKWDRWIRKKKFDMFTRFFIFLLFFPFWQFVFCLRPQIKIMPQLQHSNFHQNKSRSCNCGNRVFNLFCK